MTDLVALVRTAFFSPQGYTRRHEDDTASTWGARAVLAALAQQSPPNDAVDTAKTWLNILPKARCDTPVPIRPSVVAALIDAVEAEHHIRQISTYDRAAENEALTEKLRVASAWLRAFVICRRAPTPAELVALADRLDPGATS